MSPWARYHVKTVASETTKKGDSMRTGHRNGHSIYVYLYSWTKELFEANFTDEQ